MTILAEYCIRPPDALQVSASLVHKAEVFITNDRCLQQLQEITNVIILDELRESGS